MIDMWPQAAKELAGFSNHLKGRNMGITSNMIEMAIQMSNRYLEVLKQERFDDATYQGNSRKVS